MTTPVRVFVGIPAFGAQLYAETALALVNAATYWPDLRVEIRSSALLCLLRNQLWHEAVNLARTGDLTHFVFLDSDVAPQDPRWLDVLLREADQHHAALLGCVVPIKGRAGDTSTARETDDAWHPKNIRIDELSLLPTTWTEPGLLVPLGCVLVDMRQPWVEQITFNIADHVVRSGASYDAAARPEDWDLCRQARALGVQVFATTALRLNHWGPGSWTL